MEPVRVSSLGEVHQLIHFRGEEIGVVVSVGRKIEKLREGKGMVTLLRGKEGEKQWKVSRLDKLKKVVEVHDGLSTADALITRLLTRLDTAAAGRRVRGSLRIANLGSTSRGRRDDSANLGATSRGRRDDSANLGSTSRGRRVGASIRISNLGITPRGRRVGASFRAATSRRRPENSDSDDSAAPRRHRRVATSRRRPEDSEDSDGSAAPRRHRRAGRRHTRPRLVPVEMARDLLEAGNALQKMRLVFVEAVGKNVAGAGLRLLRQSEDRASLHALLLEVKDNIEDAWKTEFLIKDL